jgi:ribosomal protein L40E
MAEYRELNQLVPVKICPECDGRNSPTAESCVECRDSLASVATTECRAPGYGQFESDPNTEETVACPDCTLPNKVGAVRCQYCDCVLPDRFDED